ncbi:MaoC/PaaZ C-terminal domain-containing protein [Nocardioides sp. TF02-7]|uniref:MaoC/PaaZ C-terminal domain-containing protein n=1 Tax=Nocardioides sp. TF02-7 TaxID=2917724 RepID=UPI001F05A68F|nr:MaoC/PaaZ C-terminal domain-containing protein [Nocardioides sp. TF02-7]UMG93794.1 MaoC family dehydratase N-terminal domain-containing protein [Nocardioides sp. TF02-7]
MTPLVQGAELHAQEFVVRRSDLVAYAAASGDHNPIHQDEAVAVAVGLPGVVAHGMYTMALAARAVAEWTGDAEVLDLSCTFTHPVVVPEDGGATIRVGGVVKSVADDRVTLVLEVTCEGRKVLGAPKAVVRA